MAYPFVIHRLMSDGMDATSFMLAQRSPTSTYKQVCS